MHEVNKPPIDTQPTIFLVEEDDNARPNLKKNLRKQGYRVLVATDLEDAREWVSGAYIPTDLVLVDLVRKSCIFRSNVTADSALIIIKDSGG